jgi:hypothetical protein
MSRGPDNIIFEVLAKHRHDDVSDQWLAETILEAMEAEGYLSVHRDSTLMFSPDFHLQFEVNQRNKARPGAIHG